MATILRYVALFAALGLSACTFHSTATHWNGRVGLDGKPVFVMTTTTYALNLLALLPFLGDTSTDSLIAEATARIATSGSDRLRVVETESANYWFAVPLVTWFVTPVVGSVSIEYTPSSQALADAKAEQQTLDAEAESKRQKDQQHLSPESRR